MNKPEILNSDQGSHFTSPQYIDILKGNEIRISMDGKGRAKDNIFTERFWRSLKYEEVYIHQYASPRETHQGISRYINLYNHIRPHQSLQYRTQHLYIGYKIKPTALRLLSPCFPSEPAVK